MEWLCLKNFYKKSMLKIIIILETKIFLFCGLLKLNSTKGYFYKPEVGILDYIVDSEGHALYLINKSHLPSEIRDALVGGDAGSGTYNDYASLNDVYGVTSDLKVYYSSGMGSELFGITRDKLDMDNPLRTVFESNGNGAMYSLLSDFDRDNDGEISAEEIKAIKGLTITSASSITSLSELYNLPNLSELIIDSKNLESLEGIQNAPLLNYVYFKTSRIGDYSALCGLENRLKYLYMFNIDDKELAQICGDIKSAKFSELAYMAFVGNISYINSVDFELWPSADSKSSRTLTDVSPLATLNPVTKKAVRYLSLFNNNLSDTMNGEKTEVETFALEFISEFENLYLLRVENNRLTSLKGLKNMSSLAYLGARNNLFGKYEKEESDFETDSLSALKNNSSLIWLNLGLCTSLKWVHYIKDLPLTYLNLDNCTAMIDTSVTGIKGLIKRLRE